MKVFRDCFGNKVRLTDERTRHILDHPEMKALSGTVGDVLLRPEIVRKSRSDDAVRLFYVFDEKTIVGGKWVCVVVKYRVDDAFVVTAYLTDKPKAGEDVWAAK